MLPMLKLDTNSDFYVLFFNYRQTKKTARQIFKNYSFFDNVECLCCQSFFKEKQRLDSLHYRILVNTEKTNLNNVD
jgi:hypothetical protein